VVYVYRKNLKTWFCYNFSKLHLESLKNVLKNRKGELRKMVEHHYGLLDELVSNGVCDLEQVKVIEDTKSSIKYRKKLVNGLVEKLTSNPGQRKQILDILTRNNQHHVTEFIEQEGRKYCSVTEMLFCAVQWRIQGSPHRTQAVSQPVLLKPPSPLSAHKQATKSLTLTEEC
jgi:polyhydroxyalkanoate synthesis regulator phasin